MSLVPNWLRGIAVTSISINPQTVGSDGTLTAIGSEALTGLLESIEPEQYNTVDNIVPMDVRQDNELIIGSGFRCTVTEILSKTTGSSFNVLSQLAAAYDYAVFNFTRGGKAYAGTFVVISYKETIVRGKSMGVMMLGPAGIAGTLS